MTTAAPAKLRARQLCELAGISYRQFDLWRSHGVLPGVDTDPGSGSVCRYSDELAPILRFLARLGSTAADGNRAPGRPQPSAVRYSMLRQAALCLHGCPHLLDATWLYVTPAGAVTTMPGVSTAFMMHRSHWAGADHWADPA